MAGQIDSGEPSAPTHQPPRLAEWFVLCSLAALPQERDAVLGDLAEGYRQRVGATGRKCAARWYYRQAVWSVIPNLFRRIRQSQGDHMPFDMHESRPPAGVLSGAATDIWLAVRGLRRRLWFTTTAVVTLALGIGAMTAVFSVVDATVLRAMTVPQSGRLVALWGTFDRYPTREFQISMAEFSDLQSDVTSFVSVGAWFSSESLFEPPDGGAARTVRVANAFGDLYPVVGAETVLGRLPNDGDDRIGAAPVAVLSHEFWRAAFGANPQVIGTRPLQAGGQTPEIIGVLAPGVALPLNDADVWVHTVLNPALWATNRSGHGLTVIARLRDNANVESAREELTLLQRQWAARYPGQHSFGLDGHHLSLTGLPERVLGRARSVGAVLAIASSLLLVLACANVANLLLASGQSRAAELGLRVALGASRRRVAQPVFVEGLALGACGGALGVGFAAVGLPAIVRLAPPNLAQITVAQIDLRVVLFAIVVSVVSAMLSTVIPVWHAVRNAPSNSLRVSDRSRTGTTRGLRVLVAGQVALATCLLIGAGLLAVSLYKLNAVSPGLETSSRTAMDLTLPAARFQSVEAITAFYDQVQERLSSLPHVRSVAGVRTLPLRDTQRLESISPEGSIDSADRLGVAVQAGTTDVLRALGIPLLDGRDLAAGDRLGGLRVSLLSQSAARALWPGESAVGKRIRATFLPESAGLITVVGVFGDVRGAGLGAIPSAELILPVAQAEGMTGWVRNLRVVLHTSRESPDIVNAARAALRDLDPGVAVERPTTLDDVLRVSTARERLLALLLMVFSGLAIVVASVGVFGVVSFTVARESRAFAIRHALGARHGQIVRTILVSNATTAAVGAVMGTTVAALAAPILGSYLHDVAPRNIWVPTAAPVCLILVAIGAAVIPAVRATRVPLTEVLQRND